MKQYTLIADAAQYAFTKKLLSLLELEEYIEAEYNGTEIYIRVWKEKEFMRVINGINDLTLATALKLDLMLLEMEESLAQNSEEKNRS